MQARQIILYIINIIVTIDYMGSATTEMELGLRIFAHQKCYLLSSRITQTILNSMQIYPSKVIYLRDVPRAGNTRIENYHGRGTIKLQCCMVFVCDPAACKFSNLL